VATGESGAAAYAIPLARRAWRGRRGFWVELGAERAADARAWFATIDRHRRAVLDPIGWREFVVPPPTPLARQRTRLSVVRR